MCLLVFYFRDLKKKNFRNNKINSAPPNNGDGATFGGVEAPASLAPADEAVPAALRFLEDGTTESSIACKLKYKI